MKSLTRIFILFFIVGIVLTIISFTSGLTFEMVEDYLNDDESYSDMMSYTSSSAITEVNFDIEDRHIVIERTNSLELLATYYEHEDDTWTISEQNGILNIKQEKDKSVRFLINFKFTSRSLKTVTLYVPESLNLNINLETIYGDIDINNDNNTFNTLSITSITGDIKINGGTYDGLTVSLITGDVSLTDLNASSILLSLTTGDILFKDSILTGNLVVNLNTGDLFIYDTLALGYNADTNTGDIYFRYLLPLDIRYDLKVITGYIKIDENKQGTRHSTTTGSVLLKAESITGNIIVTTQ